ncbi:hypothetical protein GCM10027027_11260 [Neomicrococcus lactis]
MPHFCTPTVFPQIVLETTIECELIPALYRASRMELTSTGGHNSAYYSAAGPQGPLAEGQ